MVSTAHLLDDQIEATLTHVNRLKVRITDMRSKVLVTSDLNAGELTLVDALLHRDVFAIDQQPLTSDFCEVHDVLENDNVEEVHLIPLDKVASYDHTNLAAFPRARVDDIETLPGDLDHPITH